MFLLMWCSPSKPTTAATSIQAHLSFISDKMTPRTPCIKKRLYTKDPLLQGGRGSHQGPLLQGGRGFIPRTPCFKEERLYTKDSLLQGGSGSISRTPCFKEGETLHQGLQLQGERGSTPRTQGCPRPGHNPRHFLSNLNLLVQTISISALIESLERGSTSGWWWSSWSRWEHVHKTRNCYKQNLS